MRSKEDAHDYRYFPDPDLLPLVLTQEYVDKIRAGLPELPDARKHRFIKDYGLSPYDAGVLVGRRTRPSSSRPSPRAATPSRRPTGSPAISSPCSTAAASASPSRR